MGCPKNSIIPTDFIALVIRYVIDPYGSFVASVAVDSSGLIPKSNSEETLFRQSFPCLFPKHKLAVAACRLQCLSSLWSVLVFCEKTLGKWNSIPQTAFRIILQSIRQNHNANSMVVFFTELTRSNTHIAYSTFRPF